jgi:carbonic anhydrase/acetyltransferase-like protein (isoleucine patch superfamily)
MTKKYEFTGETKVYCGTTLKRIRAVRNFTLKSGIEVAKGDLGGWLEREENLSHSDSAWVFGNAMVYDGAMVYGDAEVYGNAKVHDNAKVFAEVQVYGYAEVCGDAEVGLNAWVFDHALVNDSARVGGYAWVYGNAWVYSNGWVYGNAKVCGNARVCDKAQVYGDAKVYGDAVVGGNAEVCGYAWVYGNARVGGKAVVLGDAEVEKSSDIIWFKNIWTSGRTFTYTRSNGKWAVGCFYGTGEELIIKAYDDSEVSGKCYEAIVRVTEEIYKAIEKKNKEVANDQG